MRRRGLGPVAVVHLALGDLVAQRWRAVIAVAVLAPLAASWFLMHAVAGALLAAPPQEGERILLVTEPDLFDPATVVLTDTDLRRAADAAGSDAEFVTPLVVRVVEVGDRTVQLRGADPRLWERAAGLEYERGRVPDPLADEVAVTSSLANALGWDLGDTVRVFGTDLTITAVYRGSGSAVAALWMDITRAGRLFERPGEYQFVVVAVRDGADVGAVRMRLSEAFPNLLVMEESVVQVEMARIRLDLGRLSQVAAAASLVVMVAGSASATALALAERARMLGLLRMMGHRPQDVRHLVATQAVLVSVASGALGLFAAALLLATRPSILIYSFRLEPSVGPLAAAVGVVAMAFAAWVGAQVAVGRSLRVDVHRFLRR